MRMMVIVQAVPTPPKAVRHLIVEARTPSACPVTSPVEVFRVRPAGNVPLPIENVYGGVPPVTVIGPLSNGTPTSPVLTAEQVTCGEPMMVITQVRAGHYAIGIRHFDRERSRTPSVFP